MEKYGYKNISSKNEFEQSSKKEGKHNFSYDSSKHVAYQGFINWGDQNNWGVPGQTKYIIKTLEDLLGAREKVSEI